MTSREAYVLGWVYGLLTSAIKENTKPELAASRPYSGLARIIDKASQKRLLSGELDKQVASALWEIDAVEPELDGGSERYQPLEMQGSWQMGYFQGVAGKPLPEKPLDIRAAREKKGLSQKALADKLGVAQTLISSWEQGKCKPAPGLIEQIHSILG